MSYLIELLGSSILFEKEMNKEKKTQWVSLYKQTVLFLNTLVEGEISESRNKAMNKFLDIDMLRKQTTIVWEELIRHKHSNVLLSL